MVAGHDINEGAEFSLHCMGIKVNDTDQQQTDRYSSVK